MNLVHQQDRRDEEISNAEPWYHHKIVKLVVKEMLHIHPTLEDHTSLEIKAIARSQFSRLCMKHAHHHLLDMLCYFNTAANTYLMNHVYLP